MYDVCVGILCMRGMCGVCGMTVYVCGVYICGMCGIAEYVSVVCM